MTENEFDTFMVVRKKLNKSSRRDWQMFVKMEFKINNKLILNNWGGNQYPNIELVTCQSLIKTASW